MKIFDFDDNATSYKYPIIKLLLSVLILAAIYNRNLVFQKHTEKVSLLHHEIVSCLNTADSNSYLIYINGENYG